VDSEALTLNGAGYTGNPWNNQNIKSWVPKEAQIREEKRFFVIH